MYSVNGCVQLVGMSMVLPIGDAPVSHTHVYNVYSVRYSCLGSHSTAAVSSMTVQVVL